jgi:hypothetical protein
MREPSSPGLLGVEVSRSRGRQTSRQGKRVQQLLYEMEGEVREASNMQSPCVNGPVWIPHEL